MLFRSLDNPPHQYHIFRLIASLALKTPLPQETIDWFRDRTDIDLAGINDWVENPEILLTLWLMVAPRHGKSDVVRHSCIWLMCQNPNIRILWQSITLPISQLTTSWIKRELEENRTLSQMYGPFYKDGSWSDKEFTVATRTINLASPTMVALGKREGTQSRDADLIVVDDFVDEDSSRTINQVEQDVSRLRSQILTRRETWTPVLGIGSHEKAPYGDAYDYMEQHIEELEGGIDMPSKVLFVKIKAHDYTRCKPGEGDDRHGEWCVLWPSVRPLWFLEAQRQDLGDILFEVRFNQDSRRAGVVFFPEETIKGAFPMPAYDADLKRYADYAVSPDSPAGILDYNRSYGEFPECCQRGVGMLLRAMGVDPAAGESRRAAESSLHLLAGCRFCLRRYVVESWHDRVSPEQLPDTIDKFALLTRPHRVRIEINAYQKALARDPRLKRSAAKRRYTIDEWRTDERRDDPAIGIPGLFTDMGMGRFSLPYKTAMDQHRSQSLMRQLLLWPRKPNDQVFSLWLADGCLSNLLDEAEHEPPTRMPGWENLPEYLKQQVTRVDLSEIRENR